MEEIKRPADAEIQALKKLTGLLGKIGFNVQFSDTSWGDRNPDFIAQKRVGGQNYTIAIEVKSNSNTKHAIKYGVETLAAASKQRTYDRLLLLLLNSNSIDRNGSTFQNISRNHPTNLEIMGLDDLERWSESLNEEFEPKGTIDIYNIFRTASMQAIELIAKNPEGLRDLEWRQLEMLIAELFEGIGFKAILTPCSKDGGKDVILECRIDNIQKTYIIEIKHWRSRQKVGPKAVKEFAQVIINEKREKGLLLSTYGFTNNYYEMLTEIQKPFVRIGEEGKIVDLCRTYEKIKNGILNPVDTLEDILFTGTLGVK